MSTTSFLGAKRRRNGSKPECTEYMKGKDAWRRLRLLRAVTGEKMLVGIMSTTSFLGVKRRRNGSKPRYMEGKDAWRSLRLLRAVAEKKMRGEIMRFSCDQWGLKQEHNKCLIAGLPVETAGVMRDVLILHTLRVFRLTSVSVSLRFEKQWNGRASHDHFCVALLLEMMWSIESQKNYWQRSKGQIKL